MPCRFENLYYSTFDRVIFGGWRGVRLEVAENFDCYALELRWGVWPVTADSTAADLGGLGPENFEETQTWDLSF